MKNIFKPILVIGAAIFVGGLLTACNYHRCGGHHDPEKIAKRFEKHLTHVFDRIDTTPEQTGAIRLISAQIVADAKQLHASGMEDQEKIVACLLLDEPDREWLHDQVNQKTREMNEFTHRTVDRLIKISEILTPEQRMELKKRFDSAHGNKS